MADAVLEDTNNKEELREDTLEDIEKRAEQVEEKALEESLAKAAETEAKEEIAEEKEKEKSAEIDDEERKALALEKQIFGDESDDEKKQAGEAVDGEAKEGNDQQENNANEDGAEEPQGEELERERFTLEEDEQQAEQPTARERRPRRREVYGPPVEFEHADIAHLPSGQKVQLIKLPNFVQIRNNAFDPSNYKKEKNPEVAIRWRRTLDDKIESNARVVTWSDGSMQLLIGESEVLDVTEQSITHDNNFLFTVHPGSFLRCETKLASKVNVLPASSDTKAYQLLSEKLAEKKDEKRLTKKKARIYIDGATQNPEKEQEGRMKAEEERLRSKEKLNSERRKMMESTYKRGRLSADFLEAGEGDSDEEGGIGKIKAAFKAGVSVARKKGADDKRLMDAKSGSPAVGKKRRNEEEDQEEEPDAEESNDEGEDAAASSQKAESAKEKAESTGRKKKSHVIESDDE